MLYFDNVAIYYDDLNPAFEIIVSLFLMTKVDHVASDHIMIKIDKSNCKYMFQLY